MRYIPAAVSAVFLCFSVGSAGAVELIVNGGFETGNFTPVSPSIQNYDQINQGGPQDLTGWTVGNSLVWGLGASDINTHMGKGYVDLTGIGDTTPHGILNQTISTIIGQQYTFSLFATQDFRGSLGFDVLTNGVALALSGLPGFWDYSPTGATYGQLTGVFTAASTSTTIALVGRVLGSRQFMIGLDDVSVTGPAPMSAVPLPAALPLLTSGVGALGLLLFGKRRRRATAAGDAAAH
jgi:hypothetical protein